MAHVLQWCCQYLTQWQSLQYDQLCHLHDQSGFNHPTSCSSLSRLSEEELPPRHHLEIMQLHWELYVQYSTLETEFLGIANLKNQQINLFIRYLWCLTYYQMSWHQVLVLLQHLLQMMESQNQFNPQGQSNLQPNLPETLAAFSPVSCFLTLLPLPQSHT